MSARKKASPLTGKKATVFMERNGLSIRIDDVPAADAACVALDLLAAFRLLRRGYAELTPDLHPVGGYAPLDTLDDDWADDGKRKIGFQ